jgi:predicted HTH transcriptional regulator
MAADMEAHGLPRPRFEEVGSEFRVTLMGPGEQFMQNMKARPTWAESLNERQLEAVLYAGEHGRITTAEYGDLVGVSDVTAYRDLNELCEKELLVRRGGGRATHYVVAGMKGL